MKKGFVGNGTDKFTEQGKASAVILMYELMFGAEAMVSGHSPVGGIDIWAEEVANDLGIPLDLKIPEINQWNPIGGYGYKARNLDIAKDSDELHVILADVYPEEYRGRRFKYCYHHSPVKTDHVKSGGCWTGKQAERLGTPTFWHIVNNY